jgi:vacuolar-type H+-ATPase subunit I/STV1
MAAFMTGRRLIPLARQFQSRVVPSLNRRAVIPPTYITNSPLTRRFTKDTSLTIEDRLTNVEKLVDLRMSLEVEKLSKEMGERIAEWQKSDLLKKFNEMDAKIENIGDRLDALEISATVGLNRIPRDKDEGFNRIRDRDGKFNQFSRDMDAAFTQMRKDIANNTCTITLYYQHDIISGVRAGQRYGQRYGQRILPRPP